MSEKTAGKVYEKAGPSVVYVVTRSGGGSGVVVGDNEVVTNCHVVDDGGPVSVFQPPRDKSGSPKESPAKVVAASVRDLCLLKTDGLSVPAADIGESGPVRIGSPVYAVGCPNGIYGSLSIGIVSQFRPAPEDSDEAAKDDIQTTAALSPGSSGGGLFDGDGRLIGITSSSAPSAEGIHFALPAELVEFLRRRAKVEARLRENLSQVLSMSQFNPGALFGMATEISDALPVLTRQIGAWAVSGEIAALSGVRNFAGEAVKRLTELSKSATREEERDDALGGIAGVLACLGKTDRALEFAEKIGGEERKNRAVASVAQEQARVEWRGGRVVERARETYKRLPLPEEIGDPESLLVMACARAEMRDSGDALDIALKILHEDRRHYPDESVRHRFFVTAVSEIAAVLHRQGTVIGAKALFEYALDHSRKADPRFLADVALCAAEVGDMETATTALRERDEFRAQIRASGRKPTEGPEYEHEVMQFGRMAETLALLGDPRCFEEMRRILILDVDLTAALVRAAIGPIAP